MCNTSRSSSLKWIKVVPARDDDICSGESSEESPLGIVLATEVNKRIDYTKTNKRVSRGREEGRWIGEGSVRPGSLGFGRGGEKGAKERRGDGPDCREKNSGSPRRAIIGSSAAIGK